jgi:two-component system response regulator QseB
MRGLMNAVTPFLQSSVGWNGKAKKRLLLVDDDEDLGSILEIGLEEADFCVTRAMDGVEGWALYCSQPWDVVVTDRAMPRMNGEELAACIRASQPHQRIVLITGLTRAIQRPELFNRILGKPFAMGELIEAAGGVPVGTLGGA